MTSSLSSFDTYISTVQSSPSSANTALPPHPRLQTFHPPSAHSVSCPSAPSPLSLASGCPSLPPLPPDSLRVLQWNAGDLRARSTELLHSLSSYSVDLICIQESNLNSSSSFRIPGFSVLRSDHTHSRPGILCVTPRTLAAVSSFLSGRADPSLNFLPLLFLSLIPECMGDDYVCWGQHLIM